MYERLPPLPVMLESSLRRIGLHPPAFLLNWASLARLDPLFRAYQEINLALVRLRRKPGPDATPNERAAVLVRALPSTRIPAEVLVDEYQKVMYGHAQDANLPDANHASAEIRRLSFRAWFRNLLSADDRTPGSSD